METTEKKISHTPGAWQRSTVPFELRNTDDAATIYGPMSRDGGACLIACVSRSPGDKEATANAKLIAAAPELLEALQGMISAFKALDYTNHQTDAMDKAIEAIKNATL